MTGSAILVIDIMVSGSIFLLLLSYWNLHSQQNVLEGLGYRAVAIMSFVMAAKAFYRLLDGQPDYANPMGLLFRVALLLFLLGNVAGLDRDGASILWKRQKNANKI